MRNIVVYGAGSLGREVKMLIEQINGHNPTWNILGFVDDVNPIGKEIDNTKVLGGIDFLNQYPESIAVAVAVGSPTGVKTIVDKIANDKTYFPNLIHPSIYQHHTLRMGRGNILAMGVKLTLNINLGDFNILNLGATIAHDAKIGNFNVFGPNTQISGNVTIGDLNLFGVSSVVLEKLKIGQNCTIGSCSLLVKDAENDLSYFGVPAFVMRKKN